MQSLLVHGRQPATGRAELESLYGADKLTPAGPKATILDVEAGLVAFERLGGSVKFCKILTTLDTLRWDEIERFLIEVSPDHSKQLPEGKMRLGLSSIGLDASPARLNKTALKIKTAVKKTGRNVRAVPNKTSELNAAQVLHNQLAGPTGWELVLVRYGSKTIVAQTLKVQDIESYARRDQARPRRDARVGMLPPKLAQIIINLAAGRLPQADLYLLDPFCGTGVILQEALLMGYDVYGTDIEPRMIEYSKENLEWLLNQPENRISFPAGSTERDFVKLETGDAMSHKWLPKPAIAASELYLGRPLTSLPDKPFLDGVIRECDDVAARFLKNIAGQTDKGFRLCLAVPAWKAKNGFLHLPTLDKLSGLGYNRLSFVHAGAGEMVYHRPDQTVARELIVLERK